MSVRLAPSMTADTQFFWDGAQEHRLLIQRCGGAATLRHPPRPMCPHCHRFEWDTIEASGRGTVFSFVIPHHPPLPWFPEPTSSRSSSSRRATRLVTNLVGCRTRRRVDRHAGHVRFEDFDDDVVLPLFAPVARRLTPRPSTGGRSVGASCRRW